jgi:hypothetical protein
LPRESALRRDTTDFGSIAEAAEEGLKRFRIGHPKVSVGNFRGNSLLVLGLLVLPWLPILRPPSGQTPTKRARGVGDTPTLALAFALGDRSGSDLARFPVMFDPRLVQARGGDPCPSTSTP